MHYGVYKFNNITAAGALKGVYGTFYGCFMKWVF